MKRRLYGALDRWSRDPRRKPLVLRGARQVGKSWLVRTFGTERFGSVVELNFERDPELARLFKGNDPRAILRRVEAYTGSLLSPDDTNLLFLDEIQSAPEVFAKLRWFAEELPRLPVVAAGSLLDFALSEPAFSMPVGRVSYMHLEPMGFEEFLDALGEGASARLLESSSLEDLVGALEAPMHEKLMALFRQFVLVGGMPAIVSAYRERRSLVEAAAVQRDLLATLRDDFAKYSNRVDHRRLLAVFSSVPRQLGRKFVYTAASRAERTPALARAVELLCLARVCHRVRATTASGAPLGAGAGEKFFKLLFLDVGLVSSALGLDLEALESSDLTLANVGAIAEQAVGQLLRLANPANVLPELFYWRRGEVGSEAEVDYLVQRGSTLVPIEVKAGTTGTLKSLHTLMAARRWRRAVRFNAGIPSVTPVDVTAPTGARAKYELLSLPMYLAERIDRILR